MLIPKTCSFKIGGLDVVLQPVATFIYHIRLFGVKTLFVALALSGAIVASGQSNITYDLKKNPLYDNRKLPSELTPDKKINPVKRIKENITSHYNFYFNANNKLKTVLLSAKQSYKDTFSNLLSVYNFSLDQTASQQAELDSVIIKTNNGVLLHDLRNDWVDDMFLLMGQAYFYEKKFDSAYDVFQYINYNFQPRNKDEIGFEKNIGSNVNGAGNIYTISTKEKAGVQGLLGKNAARNESLLWIVKTLMEIEQDDDAKSLIETLNNDVQFPSRLKDDLMELKGLWFYKKLQYDSAAIYLGKSFGTCANILEKARRNFLIAQLYKKANKPEQSYKAYESAIALTIDPIMEAYARIQQIGLTTKETDENKRIENNIQALLGMAKKEKYANYKGLIYASAAEIEIKRSNVENAISDLLKSNEFSQNDPDQKNINSIAIANLAFSTQKYELAKLYYDSIRIDLLPNAEEINLRKSIVGDLIKNLKIVKQEDSLQRIAKMPEKEREEYLKDQLKKLRKEKGLQEETKLNTGSSSKPSILDANTGSIFPTDNKKGEWYFNNPTLKAQGSIAFKNKWGDRPNVDNWRRISALNAVLNTKINPGQKDSTGNDTDQTVETTIETLREGIPLTSDKLTASLSNEHDAMRKTAVIYKEKLGDCIESIKLNEQILAEDPLFPGLEKVLYDLSYCYKQSGNLSKSGFYQQLLAKQFPSSEFNLVLKDPDAAARMQKEKSVAATKTYDKIYDLFLSGKFEQALKAKKIADSTFGENLWSAQLLYIEAVYYIKQKQDSLAISTLNKIPALYPTSPLAEKAGIIADVLNRRSDIENELNSMQVTRAVEEKQEYVSEHLTQTQKIEQAAIKKAPSVTVPKVVPVIKAQIDTSALKTVPIVKKVEDYIFNADEKTNIIMILTNVDVVYQNEAKRALAGFHARRFADKALEVKQDKIGDIPFLLISTFQNTVEAIDYFDLVKQMGPKELFPWLPKEKYSFLMVSSANLKRIQEEKNIENYLRFIRVQLPGKF